MTGPPCIPWHDIGVFPRFCFVVGASCLGGPPSPPNRDDVGDDVGDEGWRSRRFDLLSKAENTILHGNFTLFTRKKACIFLSWIPKRHHHRHHPRSVPQENCLFRQFFDGAEKEKREKKKEKKEKKKEKKRGKRKRKKREKREKKREKRKRKRRKK